jgi:arylsulfatase
MERINLILVAASCLVLGACGGNRAPGDADRPPNIIFILADDLGYAEVGAYGQSKIKTPNIDRLAADGILFRQHYSGSPVCAPSRGTLLTGKHTGHAYVRDNFEMGGWGPDEPEGQLPLPSSEVTVAELLRDAGYATSIVGKWGLGGPESEGHPNNQGFDHFYGYLCQRVAHNYYPTHLWRNGDRDSLKGNDYFSSHQRIVAPLADPDDYIRLYQRDTYAPDMMIDEALDFVDENRDRPFFLLFATPVPHAAIQVPDESVEPYRDTFDDTPYLGTRGYLPHATPRAGYAAMISRMDADIGRLVTLVDELGLAEETLIVFSSDNGPTYNGGTDSKFFESAGPLSGLKGSVLEGGIRVPMIARWTGTIRPGSTSDHVSAFWDFMPTAAELAGAERPDGIDGLSYLPALLGNDVSQQEHGHLYWEYHSLGGMQAVRMGDWKAVRRDIVKVDNAPIELYDLGADIGETVDVASLHPAVVQQAREIMDGRSPSPIEQWNFRK